MNVLLKNTLYKLYEKITNSYFQFNSDEEILKKTLNDFFDDYNDIIEEYKVNFTIYLYKRNDEVIENGIYNLSKTFVNQDKSKIKYKYIFTFNNYNYNYYNILIYLPFGFDNNYIIDNYYYFIRKYNKNELIDNFKLTNKKNNSITLKLLINQILEEIRFR
jgi:hypothetical protein